MDELCWQPTLTTTPPAPQDISTNGLIARWTMDSTNGLKCLDSFNNHTGTVTGCTLAAGQIGNAYQFSGSAQYIDFAAANDMPRGTDFSITLWMKCTGAFSANTMRLFEMGNSSRLPHTHTLLGADAGSFKGNLQTEDYYAGSGDFYARNTSTNLFDSTWHFIVMSRSSGVWRFWMDSGVLSQALTVNGTNFWETARPYTIGASIPDYSHSSPFKGLMDDFRIYNRQISTQECAQLYQYLP
jgi:hypothetical protein